MKKWQWALPAVVAVLGLSCGSMALAQGPPSPFEEEPAKAPLPDEAYDAPFDPSPALLPADNGPAAESAGGCACGGGRCGTATRCGGACDRGCDPCGRACGGSSLGCRGIVIGGWIDQGITANTRYPADRFNGPVTFNDRDGEYQCNQLWVYAEKVVDTGGSGWDIGGRVDFVYGTDRRFTQSNGLEDNWNTERFYGAALPQLYMDVALNNLTVRMGHFFTIIGYEVVQAPDNFFYSHAYTMQYGEPFTHTGLLASYPLGDRWTISGGFGRGWNNWEDNNHDLSFLGGVSWTSYDEATSLAFAISSGAYDDAGQYNRTMCSLVFAHQLTDRLQYVFQHDAGLDNDGGLRRKTGDADDAEWYSINQCLFYHINYHWAFGARFEWFRDDDGTRVGGIGAPGGWTLGPDIANGQIGWAGDFYELTLGFNWRPTENVNVRPECRWDWYDGPVDGAGRLPYDFGNRSNQFTFATDLIVTF